MLAVYVFRPTAKIIPLETLAMLLTGHNNLLLLLTATGYLPTTKFKFLLSNANYHLLTSRYPPTTTTHHHHHHHHSCFCSNVVGVVVVVVVAVVVVVVVVVADSSSRSSDSRRHGSSRGAHLPGARITLSRDRFRACLDQQPDWLLLLTHEWDILLTIQYHTIRNYAHATCRASCGCSLGSRHLLRQLLEVEPIPRGATEAEIDVWGSFFCRPGTWASEPVLRVFSQGIRHHSQIARDG